VSERVKEREMGERERRRLWYVQFHVFEKEEERVRVCVRMRVWVQSDLVACS